MWGSASEASTHSENHAIRSRVPSLSAHAGDMRKKVAWVFALILAASLAPDVVMLETTGSLPT